MTKKELQEKIFTFGTDYFLIDIRKDREAYYALSTEDLAKYPFCICGYILNLIIDGNLEKATVGCTTLTAGRPYLLNLLKVLSEIMK